jgi:hypothetical protein
VLVKYLGVNMDLYDDGEHEFRTEEAEVIVTFAENGGLQIKSHL